MAPEQEAAYALEHGLTKDDLSVEVQIAYDRLKNAGAQASPRAPSRVDPVPEDLALK